MTAAARHLSVVQTVTDTETGCLVWQRYVNAAGYGKAYVRGRGMLLAHRVVWEREHGPIPAGFQLDHLCRNRRCVNLDHLELVTPRENTRRGIVTKLSDDQVRQIVRRYSAGERAVLIAADFGISRRYVTQLFRRECRSDALDKEVAAA